MVENALERPPVVASQEQNSDLALSRKPKASSYYPRLGKQIEPLMPDQDVQPGSMQRW